MLMSMTTLPISVVSYLVCGLARISLPQRETHSSIACSRRAKAFGKPARCSSRSSALGNPLWIIAMKVLPSIARELRQQPGEAALDGTERTMDHSRASAAASSSDLYSPISSLQYGKCHFAGDSMTPSSDTNSETITLLTSNLLLWGCLGWYCGAEEKHP